MKIQALIAIVLLAGLQASCKLVNTHVFKVTSTPVIGAGPDVKIPTHMGYLLLPLAQINDKSRSILLGMQPFDCLAVRTAEPYDMDRREVRFTEFQLKKLPKSDPDCRKAKVKTRIYAS